jgi:large subunit ribosomal protein L9
VTVADIVAAVKAAGGPAVDKRRVEVGQPIKALGSHEVTIRVHPEVSADVTLNVVPSA